MDEPNPFDTPSDSPNRPVKTGKTISVVFSAVIGGLVGFLIGLAGIAAVFFAFPSIPGVLEVLILLVGLTLLFVLPGVAIGAVVGLALNSRMKNIVK